MKKLFLTFLFICTAVQTVYAFDFFPYTSIRGTLYLTGTKINGQSISTVVPAFASAVGMHLGERAKIEFEYNSHAMAGNQVPLNIDKEDVYVSVQIQTYMFNLFYDFTAKENYTFFAGIGGGRQIRFFICLTIPLRFTAALKDIFAPHIR